MSGAVLVSDPDLHTALAHRIRAAVLDVFAEDPDREWSASEVSRRLEDDLDRWELSHAEAELSLVSYHMKTLAKLGLIELRQAYPAGRGGSVTKRTYALTSVGRSTLDEREAAVTDRYVLDRMARLVDQQGKEAYGKLVELLRESGRSIA